MTQIAEYTATKTKRFSLLLIALLLVVFAVSFVKLPTVEAVSYFGAGPYMYWLKGPYNEKTPFTFLVGNVTVIAYSSADLAIPIENFSMWAADDAYYNSSQPIARFAFEYNNSGIINHREYYLTSDDATDGSEEIHIFFDSDPLLTYTISFMDYTGILKSYPYIKIQLLAAGLYFDVEKKPIDSQNIVTFDLQEGGRYRLQFGDGVTWTTYGDVSTTATTGIQLVLRGVDFPKTTLLTYQYVHTYAVRDFLSPLGAITVSYEDLTNQTTSVNVTITNSSDNTVGFTDVFSGSGNQTFSYTWTSADNATNYEVTVTIIHVTYGTFYFKQYLIGEYTTPDEPFSLSFLGTLPISTAVFIPALLIIFVAGCFSELSAEAGAILTTIVAVILAVLGWIPITNAALITALALSIMAGIVGARRRMQAY